MLIQYLMVQTNRREFCVFVCLCEQQKFGTVWGLNRNIIKNIFKFKNIYKHMGTIQENMIHINTKI